jgi:hypothetical protein
MAGTRKSEKSYGQRLSPPTAFFKDLNLGQRPIIGSWPRSASGLGWAAKPLQLILRGNLIAAVDYEGFKGYFSMFEPQSKLLFKGG